MNDQERRSFLLADTRTGVVSTVRADGRPHAAPVWFTLDGDDILFTTGADTVKGRNLRRTGRAAFVVDEPTPPFDFVLVEGAVEITDDPDELLLWSLRLATRYMGEEQGESFGRRNAVPGELLVRLRPDSTVALSAISE